MSDKPAKLDMRALFGAKPLPTPLNPSLICTDKLNIQTNTKKSTNSKAKAEIASTKPTKCSIVTPHPLLNDESSLKTSKSLPKISTPCLRVQSMIETTNFTNDIECSSLISSLESNIDLGDALFDYDGSTQDENDPILSISTTTIASKPTTNDITASTTTPTEKGPNAFQLLMSKKSTLPSKPLHPEAILKSGPKNAKSIEIITNMNKLSTPHTCSSTIDLNDDDSADLFPKRSSLNDDNEKVDVFQFLKQKQQALQQQAIVQSLRSDSANIDGRSSTDHRNDKDAPSKGLNPNSIPLSSVNSPSSLHSFSLLQAVSESNFFLHQKQYQLQSHQTLFGPKITSANSIIKPFDISLHTDSARSSWTARELIIDSDNIAPIPHISDNDSQKYQNDQFQFQLADFPSNQPLSNSKSTSTQENLPVHQINTKHTPQQHIPQLHTLNHSPKSTPHFSSFLQQDFSITPSPHHQQFSSTSQFIPPFFHTLHSPLNNPWSDSTFLAHIINTYLSFLGHSTPTPFHLTNIDSTSTQSSSILPQFDDQRQIDRIETLQNVISILLQLIPRFEQHYVLNPPNLQLETDFTSSNHHKIHDNTTNNGSFHAISKKSSLIPTNFVHSTSPSNNIDEVDLTRTDSFTLISNSSLENNHTPHALTMFLLNSIKEEFYANQQSYFALLAFKQPLQNTSTTIQESEILSAQSTIPIPISSPLSTTDPIQSVTSPPIMLDTITPAEIGEEKLKQKPPQLVLPQTPYSTLHDIVTAANLTNPMFIFEDAYLSIIYQSLPNTSTAINIIAQYLQRFHQKLHYKRTKQTQPSIFSPSTSISTLIPPYSTQSSKFQNFHKFHKFARPLHFPLSISLSTIISHYFLPSFTTNLPSKTQLPPSTCLQNDKKQHSSPNFEDFFKINNTISDFAPLLSTSLIPTCALILLGHHNIDKSTIVHFASLLANHSLLEINNTTNHTARSIFTTCYEASQSLRVTRTSQYTQIPFGNGLNTNLGSNSTPATSNPFVASSNTQQIQSRVNLFDLERDQDMLTSHKEMMILAETTTLLSRNDKIDKNDKNDKNKPKSATDKGGIFASMKQSGGTASTMTDDDPTEMVKSNPSTKHSLFDDLSETENLPKLTENILHRSGISSEKGELVEVDLTTPTKSPRLFRHKMTASVKYISESTGDSTSEDVFDEDVKKPQRKKTKKKTTKNEQLEKIIEVKKPVSLPNKNIMSMFGMKKKPDDEAINDSFSLVQVVDLHIQAISADKPVTNTPPPQIIILNDHNSIASSAKAKVLSLGDVETQSTQIEKLISKDTPCSKPTHNEQNDSKMNDNSSDEETIVIKKVKITTPIKTPQKITPKKATTSDPNFTPRRSNRIAVTIIDSDTDDSTSEEHKKDIGAKKLAAKYCFSSSTSEEFSSNSSVSTEEQSDDFIDDDDNDDDKWSSRGKKKRSKKVTPSKNQKNFFTTPSKTPNKGNSTGTPASTTKKGVHVDFDDVDFWGEIVVPKSQVRSTTSTTSTMMYDGNLLIEEEITRKVTQLSDGNAKKAKNKPFGNDLNEKSLYQSQKETDLFFVQKQTLCTELVSKMKPQRVDGTVIFFDQLDLIFQEADTNANNTNILSSNGLFFQETTVTTDGISSNEQSSTQIRPPNSLLSLGKTSADKDPNSLPNGSSTTNLETSIDRLLDKSKVPFIFTAETLPSVFTYRTSDISHYVTYDTSRLEHSLSGIHKTEDAHSILQNTLSSFSTFNTAQFELNSGITAPDYTQFFKNRIPSEIIAHKVHQTGKVHVFETNQDNLNNVIFVMYCCIIDTIFPHIHRLHQMFANSFISVPSNEISNQHIEKHANIPTCEEIAQKAQIFDKNTLLSQVDPQLFFHILKYVSIVCTSNHGNIKAITRQIVLDQDILVHFALVFYSPLTTSASTCPITTSASTCPIEQSSILILTNDDADLFDDDNTNGRVSNIMADIVDNVDNDDDLFSQTQQSQDTSKLSSNNIHTSENQPIHHTDLLTNDEGTTFGNFYDNCNENILLPIQSSLHTSLTRPQSTNFHHISQSISQSILSSTLSNVFSLPNQFTTATNHSRNINSQLSHSSALLNHYSTINAFVSSLSPQSLAHYTSCGTFNAQLTTSLKSSLFPFFSPPSLPTTNLDTIFGNNDKNTEQILTTMISVPKKAHPIHFWLSEPIYPLDEYNSMLALLKPSEKYDTYYDSDGNFLDDENSIQFKRNGRNNNIRGGSRHKADVSSTDYSSDSSTSSDTSSEEELGNKRGIRNKIPIRVNKAKKDRISASNPQKEVKSVMSHDQNDFFASVNLYSHFLDEKWTKTNQLSWDFQYNYSLPTPSTNLSSIRNSIYDSKSYYEFTPGVYNTVNYIYPVSTSLLLPSTASGFPISFISLPNINTLSTTLCEVIARNNYIEHTIVPNQQNPRSHQSSTSTQSTRKHDTSSNQNVSPIFDVSLHSRYISSPFFQPETYCDGLLTNSPLPHSCNQTQNTPYNTENYTSVTPIQSPIPKTSFPLIRTNDSTIQSPASTMFNPFFHTIFHYISSQSQPCSFSKQLTSLRAPHFNFTEFFNTISISTQTGPNHLITLITKLLHLPFYPSAPIVNFFTQPAIQQKIQTSTAPLLHFTAFHNIASQLLPLARSFSHFYWLIHYSFLPQLAALSNVLHCENEKKQVQSDKLSKYVSILPKISNTNFYLTSSSHLSKRQNPFAQSLFQTSQLTLLTSPTLPTNRGIMKALNKQHQRTIGFSNHLHLVSTLTFYLPHPSPIHFPRTHISFRSSPSSTSSQSLSFSSLLTHKLVPSKTSATFPKSSFLPSLKPATTATIAPISNEPLQFTSIVGHRVTIFDKATATKQTLKIASFPAIVTYMRQLLSQFSQIPQQSYKSTDLAMDDEVSPPQHSLTTLGLSSQQRWLLRLLPIIRAALTIDIDIYYSNLTEIKHENDFEIITHPIFVFLLSNYLNSPNAISISSESLTPIIETSPIIPTPVSITPSTTTKSYYDDDDDLFSQFSQSQLSHTVPVTNDSQMNTNGNENVFDSQISSNTDDNEEENEDELFDARLPPNSKFLVNKVFDHYHTVSSYHTSALNLYKTNPAQFSMDSIAVQPLYHSISALLQTLLKDLTFSLHTIFTNYFGPNSTDEVDLMTDNITTVCQIPSSIKLLLQTSPKSPFFDTNYQYYAQSNTNIDDEMQTSWENLVFLLLKRLSTDQISSLHCQTCGLYCECWLNRTTLQDHTKPLSGAYVIDIEYLFTTLSLDDLAPLFTASSCFSSNSSQNVITMFNSPQLWVDGCVDINIDIFTPQETSAKTSTHTNATNQSQVFYWISEAQLTEAKIYAETIYPLTNNFPSSYSSHIYKNLQHTSSLLKNYQRAMDLYDTACDFIFTNIPSVLQQDIEQKGYCGLSTVRFDLLGLLPQQTQISKHSTRKSTRSATRQTTTSNGRTVKRGVTLDIESDNDEDETQVCLKPNDIKSNHTLTPTMTTSFSSFDQNSDSNTHPLYQLSLKISSMKIPFQPSIIFPSSQTSPKATFLSSSNKSTPITSLTSEILSIAQLADTQSDIDHFSTSIYTYFSSQEYISSTQNLTNPSSLRSTISNPLPRLPISQALGNDFSVVPNYICYDSNGIINDISHLSASPSQHILSNCPSSSCIQTPEYYLSRIYNDLSKSGSTLLAQRQKHAQTHDLLTNHDEKRTKPQKLSKPINAAPQKRKADQLQDETIPPKPSSSRLTGKLLQAKLQSTQKNNKNCTQKVIVNDDESDSLIEFSSDDESRITIHRNFNSSSKKIPTPSTLADANDDLFDNTAILSPAKKSHFSSRNLASTPPNDSKLVQLLDDTLLTNTNQENHSQTHHINLNLTLDKMLRYFSQNIHRWLQKTIQSDANINAKIITQSAKSIQDDQSIKSIGISLTGTLFSTVYDAIFPFASFYRSSLHLSGCYTYYIKLLLSSLSPSLHNGFQSASNINTTTDTNSNSNYYLSQYFTAITEKINHNVYTFTHQRDNNYSQHALSTSLLTSEQLISHNTISPTNPGTNYSIQPIYSTDPLLTGSIYARNMFCNHLGQDLPSSFNSRTLSSAVNLKPYSNTVNANDMIKSKEMFSKCVDLTHPSDNILSFYTPLITEMTSYMTTLSLLFTSNLLQSIYSTHFTPNFQSSDTYGAQFDPIQSTNDNDSIKQKMHTYLSAYQNVMNITKKSVKTSSMLQSIYTYFYLTQIIPTNFITNTPNTSSQQQQSITRNQDYGARRHYYASPCMSNLSLDYYPMFVSLSRYVTQFQSAHFAQLHEIQQCNTQNFNSQITTLLQSNPDLKSPKQTSKSTATSSPSPISLGNIDYLPNFNHITHDFLQKYKSLIQTSLPASIQQKLTKLLAQNQENTISRSSRYSTRNRDQDGSQLSTFSIWFSTRFIQGDNVFGYLLYNLLALLNPVTNSDFF